MMGILKMKNEAHLKENNQINELQAAYINQRRIADNMLILKYCIEKSYKMKKCLVVTSIDFSKAFDSIKRHKIIETMMKYKIHPKIIDFIARIYTEDKTNMYLNNELMCEINISNGIRQGCNGSTTLFLIITYVILEKLAMSNVKFKCDICHIAAIFFADDGLLFAQSLEEAAEGIRLLMEIAAECGLELNKNKSSIIIFNTNEIAGEIEGIKVANEIKYLGITIVNKRNCLLAQKKKTIVEAKKYANIVLSVISRSCNKVLIGSTYWKSIVLPTVMYGSEVICYTKAEIDAIQKEENKAYRYILNAPKYTPLSTLRGEIGSSTHLTRDMKTKLLFVIHILVDGNALLKELFEDMFEHSNDLWIKNIKTYLSELGISKGKLIKLRRDEIKELITKRDTRLWREEIRSKTTLQIYQENKNSISNEYEIYDNTYASEILFQARSNTIRLNWRNRFRNEQTKCQMCEEENEDLEHFLLYCPALRDVRGKVTTLQQPYNRNIMADFLLFNRKNNHNIVKNKKILLQLWNKRKRIIAAQQAQQ